MRRLTLALVATLALGACGKEETAGNTAAVDQDLSAADFATNDATAIDAATGADANMAADVDINLIDNGGEDAEAAVLNPSAPRRRPRAAEGNTVVTANEDIVPTPAPATPVQSNSN